MSNENQMQEINQSNQQGIIQPNSTTTITINTVLANTQYSIMLKTSLREFKGNRGGPSVGDFKINIDNPSDFKPTVWAKASSFLQRGIVFTSDGGDIRCEWMVDFPTIENIDIYLQLHDVTSKRNIPWDTIDGPKLQSFMNKESILYMYIRIFNQRGSTRKFKFS